MNEIDQNEMAVWIAKYEGGAINLSIAQIKEVQRLTLCYLALIIDLHGDDDAIHELLDDMDLTGLEPI